MSTKQRMWNSVWLALRVNRMVVVPFIVVWTLYFVRYVVFDKDPDSWDANMIPLMVTVIFVFYITRDALRRNKRIKAEPEADDNQGQKA